MQATLLWNSIDSERRVRMSEQTKTAVKQGGMNTKVRYITVTAMLSAVAFVLMYLGDCHSDHAIHLSNLIFRICRHYLEALRSDQCVGY